MTSLSALITQVDVELAKVDAGKASEPWAVRDLLAALRAERVRRQKAETALDAEIARFEDLYEQHSRADDYARIVQADAHLNGLKWARAVLVGGERHQ